MSSRGDRGDDQVLGVLGRPADRSARTTWAGRPRPGRSPGDPGPAGGCAGRPRPRAGTGRTRPTQASWARRWALPPLVMWPRRVVVPLEYSGGTRPQPRERGRPREAAPVTGLAGQRQRPEPGDASAGGQASHGVGERRPVVPAGQVGGDCLQWCVAGVQHRPVVRVGRGRGGLLEALASSQRSWSVSRRCRPARPGRGAAGTCPAGAGRGCGGDHVGTGPAQVPDRFFPHGGDADRHQLPGPVQPGQPAAVAPVGLGPCRRAPWGSATARSPGSPGACGAAAGPAQGRSGRPPSRLAAGGDRQGGQRACAPTPRHGEGGRPRGSRGRGPGSPPRWCPCGRPARGRWAQGARHWARPAPSVCGSVRAIVDDPRPC